MKNFDIAVVGATGLVGREMLKILEQRKFPVGRLFPLASGREPGRAVNFCGDSLPVGVLAEFDLGGRRWRCFPPAAASVLITRQKRRRRAALLLTIPLAFVMTTMYRSSCRK